MTWTIMPLTRPQSPSILIFAMQFISVTPPVAAKSPAMSHATARAGSPPIMVKSPNNPDGLPISVFDGLRKSLAANRAQFYRDFASTVFYGFNRPGAKPMDGVIGNWWRQGMIGGAKAHYDGIKAFSETDL